MDINKLADEVYSDDLDKLADEVYAKPKESLFKKARKYAPMIASGPVGVTNLLAVQAAKKSMKKHEAEVEGQTPRGRITETGAALSRGFLNLAETGMATSQKWSPVFGKYGVAGVLSKLGYEKPTEMVGEAKQKIESAQMKLPRTREGLGGWAINVIGEGAPRLAASMASGGAMGWAGPAMVGFSSGGEQAYKEAKAAGASEAVAMRDYTLNGLTEAALEAYGVSKLLQFKSAGKGAMKSLVKNVSKGLWKKAGRDLANITGKMLKSAVVEGLEEASQSAAGFAVAALPGGKKLPRKADGSIDWWAIISQIGEEAAGGALLGAIVPHGGSAIEIGGQRAMDVTPERLQRTVDMVKNSNLNEVQKAKMLREVHAIGEKKGQVYTDPDISPKSLETVDKLADNLAKLEPRRGELGKEMKKRKAAQAIRQAEALQKAIEEGADPVVAAKISQKAGEGMLKSLVPEVREGMAREDQVTLQRIINEDQRIEQFERDKLNNVMKAIFDDRVQPSRSEIKAFDRFFGTNIFQMGKRYAPMWQKALRFAWDATTKVPRAYLCSVDNSFAGVQAGIFGGIKHPKVFARDVAQGLKMLASADYAKLTEIEIKTNPLYEQALHDGLPIEGKEEYFESDLAEKIPLIGFIPRVSNRAFSNGLHKLRLDYYKLDMDANQEAAQNGSWRKQIADHIGNITGSGRIPGRDTRIGKFISEGASAALWAPKLYVGAAKTWTDIATKPAIRKMVAADLIKPVGVGIAILALVKAMFPDKAEVELNPTSSDFARIKYGNTRINFFGQHQQMARLVAQLVLGKTKSTATGRFTKVQRHKIALRYLRFKLNPATAVPVDVATGTTALGERMQYEPEFMAGYAAEHVTPLFLQDMVDAVRYQGWNTAMAIAPAAFHGIATQTYEKNARAELADLRNHYAHEIFGVDWDQLGPDYQKAITEARPILDEYKRKAAIEAEDFNYQSRMQEEQRQMGRAIRKALPKKVQHVFEDLGISTSIGRRISSNWYLDEERYKEYQKGVTELLKNNIPKIINQPKWNTLDKAVQYEYLQGVVKAAKDYVRGEIIAKANFEDYQRTQIGELPE